jgi:2-keto-3-deoxy-L-rhamnonate aldolase RhmA
MIAKAKAAGVPVGALGMDPAFVRLLFDAGADFLAYGIDTILMYQKCREIVERVEGASYGLSCSPPQP